MKISSMKYEGGNLILSAQGSEIPNLINNFKADSEYELRKVKKRRSLDANAYAWVLIDKLAEASGFPKSTVYRLAIREVGGNSDIVCVKEEAAEKLVEGWEHNGLGWQADMSTSKIPGCVNVILYYGSSTFDVSQMSRFIDNLVQDCKSVGIETMPPDKLALLLEEWK